MARIEGPGGETIDTDEENRKKDEEESFAPIEDERRSTGVGVDTRSTSTSSSSSSGSSSSGAPRRSSSPGVDRRDVETSDPEPEPDPAPDPTPSVDGPQLETPGGETREAPSETVQEQESAPAPTEESQAEPAPAPDPTLEDRDGELGEQATAAGRDFLADQGIDAGEYEEYDTGDLVDVRWADEEEGSAIIEFTDAGERLFARETVEENPEEFGLPTGVPDDAWEIVDIDDGLGIEFTDEFANMRERNFGRALAGLDASPPDPTAVDARARTRRTALDAITGGPTDPVATDARARNRRNAVDAIAGGPMDPVATDARARNRRNAVAGVTDAPTPDAGGFVEDTAPIDEEPDNAFERFDQGVDDVIEDGTEYFEERSVGDELRASGELFGVHTPVTATERLVTGSSGDMPGPAERATTGFFGSAFELADVPGAAAGGLKLADAWRDYSRYGFGGDQDEVRAPFGMEEDTPETWEEQTEDFDRFVADLELAGATLFEAEQQRYRADRASYVGGAGGTLAGSYLVGTAGVRALGAGKRRAGFRQQLDDAAPSTQQIDADDLAPARADPDQTSVRPEFERGPDFDADDLTRRRSTEVSRRDLDPDAQPSGSGNLWISEIGPRGAAGTARRQEVRRWAENVPDDDLRRLVDVEESLVSDLDGPTSAGFGSEFAAGATLTGADADATALDAGEDVTDRYVYNPGTQLFDDRGEFREFDDAAGGFDDTSVDVSVNQANSFAAEIDAEADAVGAELDVEADQIGADLGPDFDTATDTGLDGMTDEDLGLGSDTGLDGDVGFGTPAPGAIQEPRVPPALDLAAPEPRPPGRTTREPRPVGGGGPGGRRPRLPDFDLGLKSRDPAPDTPEPFEFAERQFEASLPSPGQLLGIGGGGKKKKKKKRDEFDFDGFGDFGDFGDLDDDFADLEERFGF